MIQIVTPLWGHADTILDIIQTKKYFDLSNNKLIETSNISSGEIIRDIAIDPGNTSPTNYHISATYFQVSIISFITPVFLTLLLQIKRRTFVDKIEHFYEYLIKKLAIVGPKKKIFIRVTLYLFIYPPVQILLAFYNYYYAIPMALLREGINKVMYGEDEIRTLKFGLLTNVLKETPVKNVPLYAALEPLGEASIQTILSLIFLINNWEFVRNDDYFLGVKCPISIISMIFSCVSLAKGLWGIFNFVKMKVKQRMTRMNTLMYCI